jgi:hypothetical protein
MLIVYSQSVNMPKKTKLPPQPEYIMWVMLNQEPFGSHTDKWMIADYPDFKTLRGTLANSYGLAKKFKSSEHAINWLKRKNLQLTTDSGQIVSIVQYCVISIPDQDDWLNNRPIGNWMERDYNFQWLPINEQN